MNIKIIGIGGTGSILVDLISRYVSYLPVKDKKITLIDGDVVERKNFERQTLTKAGELKVLDKLEQVKALYRNIEFSYSPVYVDQNNITSIISESDIIFLCVDNHKTRKIVDEYCQKLNNIVLISSGNEEVDGSCQIYVKRGGEEVTNPISRFHPEIKEASDKLPTEPVGCKDIVDETPQLFFTNATSAIIMCWLFRTFLEKRDLSEEVYFDIDKMKVQPSRRRVVRCP